MWWPSRTTTLTFQELARFGKTPKKIQAIRRSRRSAHASTIPGLAGVGTLESDVATRSTTNPSLGPAQALEIYDGRMNHLSRLGSMFPVAVVVAFVMRVGVAGRSVIVRVIMEQVHRNQQFRVAQNGSWWTVRDDLMVFGKDNAAVG